MRKIIISTIFILMFIFFINFETNAENISGNIDLERAILTNIKVTNKGNRYITFYEDINGGTTSEVLVYLWGPDFSSSGGNTLLVFSKNNGEYSFISKTHVMNCIGIDKRALNNYLDILQELGILYTGYVCETVRNNEIKSRYVYATSEELLNQAI